jgi:hypothetical protein
MAKHLLVNYVYAWRRVSPTFPEMQWRRGLAAHAAELAGDADIDGNART